MTLLTTRWSWHKPSEPVQLRFWFPHVLPALHRSFLCCLTAFSLRKTPYEAPHGLHLFCSEGPWPCHGCRQTPSENQEVWRRNWIEDKFHAFAARFGSSKHQNRSRPLRPLHSWFITCSYEHLRASGRVERTGLCKVTFRNSTSAKVVETVTGSAARNNACFGDCEGSMCNCNTEKW